VKAAALLLALVAVTPARAGETVDVRVTASVLAVCKVLAATDLQFGALDPSQAVSSSASGQVSFACTRGVDYRLTADRGQHYDAAGARRRMKGRGDAYLAYALEADSFTGVGQGFRNPVSITLRARVSGEDYRDLPADSYADVLRLTLDP